MKYNPSQINRLKKLIKKHADGTKDEKLIAEKELHKYGCNSTVDAFNIVRAYMRKPKNAKV